jgi:hypothetical protein
METLFTFLIIITLIDIFYRKLFTKQEEEREEQVLDPTNDVLKEDKRQIRQYLKTKKYQLTLSITLKNKEALSIVKERTYFINFKNERNEDGTASIIIDNNGNIKLVNLNIFKRYRTLKPKSKTYDELLAENIRYKSKLKEVKKVMRGL